ncbi:MAG TPA: endonuclease/exonuclease/phosphatase family protein [Chthoniobacterales bacterium]
MRHPRPLDILLVLAGFASLCLPARAADPFTIVSYNVRNWLATDRFVTGQPQPESAKTDAEKDAAVAVIVAHRPAVVGIQEIGSRDDLADLSRRLKAAGLDLPHTEWHEGIDSERHVAVLSRFPIVERASQDRIDIDIDGRPNGMQRGILDVTIEPAPGYRLRLIGLHLKSRRKVPNVDEATLRAREAWSVRQYLDGILDKAPNTRLLLFGDLNASKDAYPVREILGPPGPTRLTDIPVADSRGERWTHYFTTADEYSRIDFFMASTALLPQIDRQKSGVDDSPRWHDASDHRALFLTIDPP